MITIRNVFFGCWFFFISLVLLGIIYTLVTDFIDKKTGRGMEYLENSFEYHLP